MTKKVETKNIKNVINDIINQEQLIHGINNIKVINSWKKVVGKNILSYTNNIKFSNGNLFVKLKSAPLKNELSYNKEKIITKINAELEIPIVKKIIFN